MGKYEGQIGLSTPANYLSTMGKEANEDTF
jgi:hypothetical protein